MPKPKRHNAKMEALKKQGALNLHPENVDEPLFRDRPFFDPRDLVQLRYEMLRAVSEDGRSVSEVTARFGCSRPTYYVTREHFDEEGLVGLLPRKRGPRGGHKLTDDVLDFVREQLYEDGSLAGLDLAERVRRRFGMEVYASSIRRALSRRKKIDLEWVDHYEHLRKRGLEIGSRLLDGAQGLVLFLRQGMMAWMTELVAVAPRPSVRSSPPDRGPAVDEGCVEIMWTLASMVGSAVKEVQR